MAALRADPDLAGVGVFDAPPQDAAPPYVAIARHDLLSRDGDAAPGHEHRVTLHCVGRAEPSRKAALGIAERVVAVAEALTATGARGHARGEHERTDTAIDAETGQARAAVALRFFSEPRLSEDLT